MNNDNFLHALKPVHKYKRKTYMESYLKKSNLIIVLNFIRGWVKKLSGRDVILLDGPKGLLPAWRWWEGMCCDF